MPGEGIAGDAAFVKGDGIGAGIGSYTGEAPDDGKIVFFIAAGVFEFCGGDLQVIHGVKLAVFSR